MECLEDSVCLLISDFLPAQQTISAAPRTRWARMAASEFPSGGGDFLLPPVAREEALIDW